MIKLRHIPLVLKHILRHRARSILTILGIAVAMFLFCTVQAMQQGVRAATEVSAGDTTLVVYRENRYCPFSSRSRSITRAESNPSPAWPARHQCVFSYRTAGRRSMSSPSGAWGAMNSSASTCRNST